MPGAVKSVSFTVVIALLLGWGALGYLFAQASNSLISTESDPLAAPVKLQKGVRLSLTVDKKVYAAKERILISLRNDSRLPITLAKTVDNCAPQWWSVERFDSTEEWAPVPLVKTDCNQVSTGLENFPKHSLNVDAWDGLVPAGGIGNLFVAAPTGTYRISVPYQTGEAPLESWRDAKRMVSEVFTIQQLDAS